MTPSNTNADADEMEDDDKLLESVDIETLQNLCKEYGVTYSTAATKPDLLQILREFANQQAELEQQRRQKRAERVEAGFEGKARHTIIEQTFGEAEEDGEDETQGFFYFSAPETVKEKKEREEEQRQKRMEKMQKHRASQSPPPPVDIKPNEKGERVVTVYNTEDKNDMTGVTSQMPFSQSDMTMNGSYQQSSNKNAQPEDGLIGGPFGDSGGAKRKRADAGEIEQAKDEIRELVKELLATTGAPAFQDDFLDDEDAEGGGNSFSSPYGFTGFQPERIPPDLIARSSTALRIQNGQALREILSDYELQAIGHDGMAADDKSEGGGHYREVEKVGSFLGGFRKAEERRIARETTTMLLDRLVKEGVVGLDKMLSGMIREGESSAMKGGESGEVGELNGALVRYLEEAIREQEQRVQRNKVQRSANNDAQSPQQDDEMELMWNVTRSEDGTVIETIDPNNPLVGKMLEDELQKQKNVARHQDNILWSMTVQEKMLLLLKLLRDRVKVEAVIGNDQHARNLRILAYCLKARTDEERQQLIVEELGMSLDVSVVYYSSYLISFLLYMEPLLSNPITHFSHHCMKCIFVFSRLIFSPT